MLHNQSTFSVYPILYYDGKRDNASGKLLPYPPDTKGFLYYATPAGKPRIAGELRFRVTSSDDPASFESGSDLLKSNGETWFRRLFALSKCKIYVSLYEKLKEDLLVPDDLHTVLSTFPYKSPRYHQSQTLFTLNDTFIIELGAMVQRIFFITEQGMESLRFTGPFSEQTEHHISNPFTGAYTNHHILIDNSYESV